MNAGAASVRPARLLVTCDDRRGVIAAVSSFIAERCGNILDLDQHADAPPPEGSGVFVMRLEFERRGLTCTLDDFEASFVALADDMSLRWTLDWCADTPALAVFASREDHCLSDLLWRAGRGELGARIALVISNHEDCRPLCEHAGVAFHHLPVTPETKPAQEQAAADLIDASGASLIVLARYMQVLSPGFVARYPGRIINIHHSFLPAFAGARPYHRAHERGVKLIGATAHYVTDELDEGPIIAQQTAPVTHRDSVANLVRTGRDLERLTLARAVRLHIEDRVLTLGNRTVVFE